MRQKMGVTGGGFSSMLELHEVQCKVWWTRISRDFHPCTNLKRGVYTTDRQAGLTCGSDLLDLRCRSRGTFLRHSSRYGRCPQSPARWIHWCWALASSATKSTKTTSWIICRTVPSHYKARKESGWKYSAFEALECVEAVKPACCGTHWAAWAFHDSPIPGMHQLLWYLSRIPT